MLSVHRVLQEPIPWLETEIETNNRTCQKEEEMHNLQSIKTQNHRNPREIEKRKATLLQLALWVLIRAEVRSFNSCSNHH